MFIPFWQMSQRYRLLRLGLVLTAGLGAITLAILVVLPIVQPVFHFPKPAGPYAIGTLTYHLTDSNRAEIFSADASRRRELMVQIWYPAKPAKQLPSPPLRAPYVQDGNHVLLRCKDADVLMGHFKPGSLKVAVGQQVTVSQLIANVGNSGNTGEPHLHVHAQQAGTAAAPFSGEPLPVRFDGRFLVRNDRVSSL